jgi:hypothetical protein
MWRASRILATCPRWHKVPPRVCYLSGSTLLAISVQPPHNIKCNPAREHLQRDTRPLNKVIPAHDPRHARRPSAGGTFAALFNKNNMQCNLPY